MAKNGVEAGFVITFVARFMAAFRADLNFSGIYKDRLFPSREHAERVLAKLERNNGKKGRFLFDNKIEEAVRVNGVFFTRQRSSTRKEAS